MNQHLNSQRQWPVLRRAPEAGYKHKVFDMDMQQVARLAAWHEDAFGWLHLPDPAGLLDLREAWHIQWPNLPDGSVLLLGLSEPRRNYLFAMQIFTRCY